MKTVKTVLRPERLRQVRDKHVVVIDDCTTYGVSFGIAAAFLSKAGAASVTGVALGKFGDRLQYHKIDIDSDPFAPVVKGGFTAAAPAGFPGTNNNAAQQVLRSRCCER
jgi:hypoxanthine-guanine phosphoribosyltransferase